MKLILINWTIKRDGGVKIHTFAWLAFKPLSCSPSVAKQPIRADSWSMNQTKILPPGWLLWRIFIMCFDTGLCIHKVVWHSEISAQNQTSVNRLQSSICGHTNSPPPPSSAFKTAMWKLITVMSILGSKDMLMVIWIYGDWCEGLNEVARN